MSDSTVQWYADIQFWKTIRLLGLRDYAIFTGCIYKTGMMFAALIDSNTLGIKEVNEIGQ